MTELSPFDVEAAVPDDWGARFGPLGVIGAHARVVVLSTADGRFIKVHDEPERGRREARMLLQPPPVAAPRLLEQLSTTAGQAVLVLANARRSPRLRRLGAVQAVEAAALLARVHRSPWSGPVADDPGRWRSRVRDPRLPESLRAQIAGMTPLGDATCHQDVHASNWLHEGGRLVGLLDWASAGRGDPEEDVAQVVLEADRADREAVVASWESEARLPLDRWRLWAYEVLLAAENAVRKHGALPAMAAPPPRRRPAPIDAGASCRVRAAWDGSIGEVETWLHDVLAPRGVWVDAPRIAEDGSKGRR
jgi:Ser/Thr protein kinase RdoA (MazF antagonist)